MIPPPPADAPVAGPTGADPSGVAADSAPTYVSDEVTVGGETDGYDDDDPTALADFRGALDTHGAWVEDPTYGTIWVPSADAVGPDFQPYVTAGHWAYDDDWVWVSDYDWGWAPFHYGRWVWVQGRGWSWIPGRAYRGAWVTWGVDDGYTYVGWAPMGPAFLWFGGRPVGFSGYLAPRWVYCPRRDVFSPAVRAHVMAGAAAAPMGQRVRPFVSATPGVAGPSPQKMGFQTQQITRASGAAGVGVARAQQFARPTTAEALGAHAPTRVPTARISPIGPTVGGPREAGGTPHAFTTGPATASPAFRAPTTSGQGPAPARPAPRIAPAAPMPRAMHGPSVRGGGGHHR